MAGLFSSIAHWSLIGLGSILSIFPGGAAVGAPLMVAGAAIPTKNSGTQDVVSTYATNLQNGINTAEKLQTVNSGSYATNAVAGFLQQNMILVLAVLGAVILIIFKPFKRRRR